MPTFYPKALVVPHLLQKLCVDWDDYAIIRNIRNKSLELGSRVTGRLKGIIL